MGCGMWVLGETSTRISSQWKVSFSPTWRPICVQHRTFFTGLFSSLSINGHALTRFDKQFPIYCAIWIPPPKTPSAMCHHTLVLSTAQLSSLTLVFKCSWDLRMFSISYLLHLGDAKKPHSFSNSLGSLSFPHSRIVSFKFAHITILNSLLLPNSVNSSFGVCVGVKNLWPQEGLEFSPVENDDGNKLMTFDTNDENTIQLESND